MKKQIGIFWGPESLSLAETQRDQLIFAATIPRQIPTSSEPSTGLQNVTAPENIHLTAAVQRLIRELKINKPNVHLAIPMRDIIFRTFSLPVMNPQEIENAVMFEAPRYIPFKLNELFYTYHAVAFTEKDVKKNQILFLAIRRDAFDQYIKTLEDAELEVSFAEPSVLALLRILAIKKLAKSNQTIALVQASDTQGVVMIANHQIPQFIRDFNLFKTIASSPSEPELKSLTERILNEVRISLEFYARQNKAAHPENRIEQIYVFASQNASEIAQGLRTDLGIKATFLDINDIFPYENSLPPDMANAIGVSFGDSTSVGFDFNLVKSRKLNLKKEASEGKEDFLDRPPNYKITTAIAVICLLVIGGFFSKMQTHMVPQQQKLSKLTAFEQKYHNTSAATLDTSIADIKKKSEIYKNLRFKSNVTNCLENISKSLAEGVWLTNLEIIYTDSGKSARLANPTSSTNASEIASIRLNLTGYSYNEQLNKQISLIEGFLQKLKTNPFFAKHSKKIELTQVKKEESQKFPVTLFKIDMETGAAND